MSLTRRKIWAINISVSVIVFSLLSIFRDEFILTVGRLPQLVHKQLICLSINPLDLLIISCIPVWTYPIYQKDKIISAKRIAFINVSAILVLILTGILGFALLVFSTPTYSPLIPQYYVWMPFSFFPTLVLMAGISFTYFFYEVMKLKRRNKLSKM